MIQLVKSKYFTAECSMARDWAEWGLAIHLHANWRRNIVRDRPTPDTESPYCTCTNFSIRLLWWHFSAGLWI